MPSILKMLILGVVQGATEFLPVSSSGHLTIAQEILRITENRILFDVFLHMGTLIAILLVFRRDVLALFSSNRKWTFYLVLASVPAAVVGLTLEPLIEDAFNSVFAVGALLVLNSFVLALGSIRQRRRLRAASVLCCAPPAVAAERHLAARSEVKAASALVVGAAQSVAILPGISRAGSTVCCGLLMGWEQSLAVRFSFLLAIPAIIGAGGLEVVKHRSELATGGVALMAIVGVSVSAAAGYAALRLFLKAVERAKLWLFSGYCFLVGAGVIAYKLTV